MPKVRSELSLHGRTVESVFDLLGSNENDLTAALGFTLARSRRLVTGILGTLSVPTGDEVIIGMEVRGDDGRTDLEVSTGAELVIVEAKRGWHLPGLDQLEGYAERVRRFGLGRLVTLSDCSAAYATWTLPAVVGGVPVQHLPWSVVKAQLRVAAAGLRGTERYWLDELGAYLRRAVQVRDPADSWAYCVVLSQDKPAGGGNRTFRDFVVNDDTYFHPFGWGKGWPTDPPNFFAFRWNGEVHQIRRVIGHQVVAQLQELWPDIPPEANSTRPHAVHRLGPPMPMHAPLPSGTNYRAARLWVLVDQLLTAPTLKDAYAASRKIAGSSPDGDEPE